MGRFSTTTHIKNTTDRAGFIRAFGEVMAKRGFVPCAEDEAAKSYLLAFSEGGWVTFASESDDVPKIVADMNATSLSVEVVDSDFAILQLHAPNGRASRVVVGDGEGYGVEKVPFSADDWKPLLQNGDNEKFLAVIEQNSTFVEDTLCEIAPILGIDAKYIVEDYNELIDLAGNDEGVSAFHFKEAGTKDKPLTLNAAFVKVFGEALEPLGFKKIKGRQPYFVRVIGDEIIHVITVKKDCSYMRVIKREGFAVLSGVATVYRPKIDLSVSPSKNTKWLLNTQRMYVNTNRSDFDTELRDNGYHCFSYVMDDRESQFEAMKQALNRTQSIVLPALDDVVDIDSCARFCIMMRRCFNPSVHFDVVKGGNLNPNDVDDEGLLIMKIKDYPTFVNFRAEAHKSVLKFYTDFGPKMQDEYEKYCSNMEKIKQDKVTKMNEIVNDVEFYSAIMLELERRKQSNIETLRSYGINI